ncbi:MAG: efflux RND transporter periplasmic adaptor subunit [Gammaproteobacteria bacterium]|nr:efflux RND transporter periplasmic adaptor subunit [Gammaproteobacteria bacterium]
MILIRKLLPVLVIAVSVAIASLIYINKPVAKRRPSHPKTLTVETITLQPRQFPIIIQTQGIVEPRTTTTLIPRVSGEIIKVSPNFRPGGFFEAGETLLTIDPTDYRLDSKAAKAALAESMFNYEEEKAQSQQAADNWKRLGRTETPSDLVLRKPQLERAKAAVDSARAQLQRVQLNLQRTQIKAPYAGRILEQSVDRGQYVSPGNSLVKIFAIDYVEVRLPITEKQRGLIDLPQPYRGETNADYVGPEATIHASIGGKNYQWPGRVIRTEGTVDRSTRQVFVIVQVDNPYKKHDDGRPPLEIGQFVKADIQGQVLHDVFALPRTAVQGSNTIMVVDNDNRLQRKSIDVLWETHDQLLVNQGVSAGEKLCVTYVPFAANNVKVNVASDQQNHRSDLAHKPAHGHSSNPHSGQQGKPAASRHQDRS